MEGDLTCRTEHTPRSWWLEGGWQDSLPQPRQHAPESKWWCLRDRRPLVGRAKTTSHAEYSFNLGPHALYRGGAAAEGLRALGVSWTSGLPGLVDRTEVNCRQIGSRARRFIRANRPRFEPSPSKTERLLQGFLRASAEGDLGALLTFLREDVVMHSDGGGKATAARVPVTGAERVARFLLGLHKFDMGEYTVHVALVNGEPGVVVRKGRDPFMVLSLLWTDDGLAALYIVVNREKLQHLRA